MILSEFILKLKELNFIDISDKNRYKVQYKYNNYIIDIDSSSYFNRGYPNVYFHHNTSKTYKSYLSNYNDLYVYLNTLINNN